jgi:predicted nucleic acid-binding protein
MPGPRRLGAGRVPGAKDSKQAGVLRGELGDAGVGRAELGDEQPELELEFLYSARSLADRLEKRRLLREVFGWVAMSGRAYERADEVQQLLTETGRHRSAGPVDLLIAATAEREGLIVLCDDHNFQTVASVTGQPVKLVADQ